MATTIQLPQPMDVSTPLGTKIDTGISDIKNGKGISRKTGGNEAVLSNWRDLTSFRYGGYNIRFRTPSILKKYTEVKEWDNGYLVVMADYDGIGITEEYIDLVPILQNLYIDPETFLKNIQTVKIAPYES